MLEITQAEYNNIHTREPTKDKQTIIQENLLDVIDALSNIGFKVEYGENFNIIYSLSSHKMLWNTELRKIYDIVRYRFFSQYEEAIQEKFCYEIANEELLFRIKDFIKFHNDKALQYESNPHDSSAKQYKSQYKSLSKIFKEEFGLEQFYPTTS